jgi:hypothetical protein
MVQRKGKEVLMKRGEEFFDALATGLETGAISRLRAVKLTGAALAATALGIFALEDDAQAAVCRRLSCRAKCRRCRRSGRCCRACHRCRHHHHHRDDRSDHVSLS